MEEIKLLELLLGVCICYMLNCSDTLEMCGCLSGGDKQNMTLKNTLRLAVCQNNILFLQLRRCVTLHLLFVNLNFKTTNGVLWSPLTVFTSSNVTSK